MLFNDFKKNYQAQKKEIDDSVQRVMASGYFILGEEVKKFEENFANYLRVSHVISVGNGLEALQVSLMAMGIKEGDEVITTPHSAVATALAIKAVGAIPVFVDIDNFYHIDASKIEEKITSKTKAIIPVHLYGQPVDIRKIVDIAKKHSLVIIEDCAQAHGAEYEGQKVGTFGQFGCFSFYPTKNLGAFGDGGAIVTNDEILADKCRMIRNYGQKNRYEHEVYGVNSRLDEIQAAILSTILPQLNTNNKRRFDIAEVYRKNLSKIKQIKLPQERVGVGHVYHLFVIETEKRDELQSFLKDNNIPSLIHYPIAIHKQKCFSEYNDVSLPATEERVAKILSLPIHPYLTEDEVSFVCQKIEEFFNVNLK